LAIPRHADETRVAFTRRDDQPAGDIWTLDLAKQTPLRFTFSPDMDIYPLWTADGEGIIYSSVREGLVTRQFAATSATKQLLAPTSSLIIPTQVMPDGRLLVFGDMGTPTGFDIFAMPLAPAAPPVAVVAGTLTDAEATVSPDGRWLAYGTTETGGYEVFVQPMPPTGVKWQISTSGGRLPQWRRDGRELFFVTNDRKFYAVDVRSGATFDYDTPHVLFDIPANTISVRNSYVPGKDGKRFLVNKLLDTTVPPINVVVNWAATLEK
jgi:Tol biopolymer transport system component